MSHYFKNPPYLVIIFFTSFLLLDHSYSCELSHELTSQCSLVLHILSSVNLVALFKYFKSSLSKIAKTKFTFVLIMIQSVQYFLLML